MAERVEGRLVTRIVIDPDELDRFAGLALEAAEDYASRASALRSHEEIPMPPEFAGVVADGVARVASTIDSLAASLYAEAVTLRARAAVLDPVLRRYLLRGSAGQPG